MKYEFRAWDKKENKMIKLHLSSLYTNEENYILMQATPMFDCKGARIFEGDLIELTYTHEKGNGTAKIFKHGEVVRHESGLYEIVGKSFKVRLWSFKRQDRKIIGNTYQGRV